MFTAGLQGVEDIEWDGEQRMVRITFEGGGVLHSTVPCSLVGGVDDMKRRRVPPKKTAA